MGQNISMSVLCLFPLLYPSPCMPHTCLPYHTTAPTTLPRHFLLPHACPLHTHTHCHMPRQAYLPPVPFSQGQADQTGRSDLTFPQKKLWFWFWERKTTRTFPQLCPSHSPFPGTLLPETGQTTGTWDPAEQQKDQNPTIQYSHWLLPATDIPPQCLPT